MKFSKGDRVRRGGEQRVGTVIAIQECGIAGCAVTYIRHVKVQYEDGTVIGGDPSLFEKVDEVGS